MTALVKTTHGPGNLELRDVPIPQIQPDEVLIRERACGICGSDLKIEEDQHPYTPPVVVGHEFAGEITEIGGNVVVTPHLGWYTDGAVARILKITFEILTAFKRGEEIFQVA